jgi:hypothetical protein
MVIDGRFADVGWFWKVESKVSRNWRKEFFGFLEEL